MLLSALAGVVLGSVATTLLTAPPDHRGEMPVATISPQPRAEAPSAAAAPAAAPAEGEVELLATRQALAVRLRAPDALRLQEARVWQFGPADERAVCGTMQSPEIPGGSARFVVRVLLPRNPAAAGGRPLQTVVEDAPWLVRPTPEAARRFCRDAEPELPPPGAAQAAAQAAASGDAAAATPAIPATAPAPAPAAAPVSAPAATGERVFTQSAANLRAAPSGDVLGTVPRGRSLVVFGRAPGGWVQVGETAPEGWIHSSLLSDAAPQ